MSNVIDINPYLQFIELEFEVEDEEFLAEHPNLKRLRNYLYMRRDAYFKKETEKLLEEVRKDERNSELSRR